MILFMFPVVHFFLFFIMVHDLLFYAACTSPSCRPSSDRIVWNQFRSYACAPLRGTSSNMLANALRRDNSEKAKEIFSFLLPHRHLNCALRVHDFRFFGALMLLEGRQIVTNGNIGSCGDSSWCVRAWCGARGNNLMNVIPPLAMMETLKVRIVPDPGPGILIT